MDAPVFPRVDYVGSQVRRERLTPLLRQRVRAWIAAGAPALAVEPGSETPRSMPAGPTELDMREAVLTTRSGP